MSNTLRIKRRASNGAAGAPASLQNAELAFNEADLTLYYGFGTGGAGGSATQVIPVGGSGAFQAKSADLAAIAALSGVGMAARVGSGVWAMRRLVSNSPGITIANDDGASGNPGVGLAGNLLAIDGIAANGFLSRTGVGTFASRLLAGTAGRIVVTDGNGVNANPTIDLALSGTAGTWTKITVDAYGRATGGAQASLSDLSAPSAAMSIGGNRLTNVADPVSAQDAATKNYVDMAVQGLSPKQSVKAASTANIVSMSGAATIDGVSLTTGDRVLVKDQSSPALNGVYVVDAGGAWARSADANTWNELVGAYLFIEQGLVNADMGFLCTNDQGGTINSTAVTFVQFNGAGQITAGIGLSKSGNTLQVVGTANRISVTGGGVDIAATYTGQTSITTLGTVTTGTWRGTAVAADVGGTGQTSYNTGDLLYATSGTTLGRLAAGPANQVLLSTNINNGPVWGQIDLTRHVQFTLPMANGGLGATTPSGGRSALGLVIGSDVMGFDQKLSAFTGLSPQADRLAYFTSTNTMALATLTNYARSILASTDQSMAYSVLGLGTMASQAANNVTITGGSIDNISLDCGAF